MSTRGAVPRVHARPIRVVGRSEPSITCAPLDEPPLAQALLRCALDGWEGHVDELATGHDEIDEWGRRVRGGAACPRCLRHTHLDRVRAAS